jgi:hypothetical protein
VHLEEEENLQGKRVIKAWENIGMFKELVSH